MNNIFKYLRGVSASLRTCQDDINLPESVTWGREIIIHSIEQGIT